MVGRGFVAAGRLDLSAFAEVFSRARTWRIVWLTLAQASLGSAVSVLLGGSIRVGMEDNLKVARDTYAKSNAELVDKAVQIVRSLDREVATPAEARQILGLKGANRVAF